MEIERLKPYDLESYNAGYEEGQRHANDESFKRGYEAAILAMREAMQTVEDGYIEFERNSKI